MAHVRNLIDIRSGDEFDQPVPFGLVYPMRTADGDAPPSQRGRTWEHLAASGRELVPQR
ncbi:hypothetical protein FHS29_006751 [Saccharothrix tamanrassetensis]|uniref:Uncharacterized protein n=1 Tax=Saccharothrix tamanrassetensis TaxID=1051531 RepID=A0A841CVG2_9PSEU|nr:hypothetical protein [Saccharothrix tamanrassetensis]MBB5960128.1 hypothetical protein [Saccharothrix tamanrassetensis]